MRGAFRRLILPLLLCAALLTGCAPGEPQKYTAAFYDAFDTVTTFTAWAESQAEFDRWASQVHDELLRLHRVFDAYHPYEGVQNLYLVNRQAAEKPVACDEALLALLQYMQRMQPRMRGRVNIAMGSVTFLWRAYRQEGKALPPAQALADAAAHTDFANVRIDPDAETVRFLDEGLQLDVGAVAKGYSAEQIYAALLTSGASSFILNLGGNVRCAGIPMDGREYYAIGVQNPDGNDRIAVLQVQSAAIATSGDYQRFYVVDGVRWHHLIDPDTLYPASFMRSVTVMAPDAALSDVLSTALFLLPPDEALELAGEFDGVEALLVLPDGTLKMTEGMAALLSPASP